MMGWETPLMERHAAVICANGGAVLNVGFGLGIVDGFIQQHKVGRGAGLWLSLFLRLRPALPAPPTLPAAGRCQSGHC